MVPTVDKILVVELTYIMQAFRAQPPAPNPARRGPETADKRQEVMDITEDEVGSYGQIRPIEVATPKVWHQ